MQVYVKSRGFTPESDYSWLPSDPPDVANYKSYIDSEYPSLILYSFDNRLALLVTGSESDREDFRGRKIRNSVLWISESNGHEDEKMLRAIACEFLDNYLAGKLNQIICKDEKVSNPGFTFDQERLLNIVSMDRLDSIQSNPLSKDELKAKYATNTPRLKSDLSNLVREYELPKNGILKFLVVTGKVEESKIKDPSVWRSLSTEISDSRWQLKKKNRDPSLSASYHLSCSNPSTTDNNVEEMIPNPIDFVLSKTDIDIARFVFECQNLHDKVNSGNRLSDYDKIIIKAAEKKLNHFLNEINDIKRRDSEN
ncbi:hypothetical protein L3556_02965 [Candidatus Synechococcus calcipolaris G9]|uniref:Uncharacterized protein n=1 Tax=Candidatus Synechococcus calcipolaris G9 TaxID=1497997 RepID=A0ABT6EWP7_9SYNE|nr:hypothetical protein [Candidatus Synechococcus calcipolaris]MDG2989899.1 hypothetical protein [Candidatus Synechococcus calcipolaris G9]